MFVHRRYTCDFGHQWIVRRRADEAEEADDVICPKGHEAVTCQLEVPADEVQVLLRPAARVSDQVTGQVTLEGRYWLVLLDRNGEELRCSSETYSWEDAVSLGKLFKGKSEVRAQEWWNRKNP